MVLAHNRALYVSMRASSTGLWVISQGTPHFQLRIQASSCLVLSSQDNLSANVCSEREDSTECVGYCLQFQSCTPYSKQCFLRWERAYQCICCAACRGRRGTTHRCLCYLVQSATIQSVLALGTSSCEHQQERGSKHAHPHCRGRRQGLGQTGECS